MKIIYTFFFLIILLANSTLAQLSGGYTINSALPTAGTNFQSFNDFASALSAGGVSGNVTATVVVGSGPYNEQVTFNPYTGSGPSSVVTIEGSGETITAHTDSANRHIIRLTDLQYFAINNLRVLRDSTSLSGFYGIHIFNSGDHITVSNCHVDMHTSNSTLVGGIIASGSQTSILVTGNFNNLSILSDTTKGGGYGASVFGLAFPLARNILIGHNTFLDFHSNGVYLRETDSAVVRDNYFDKSTASITSVNAIQVAQNANMNSNIYNNYIKVSQTNNGTVTFRGIYLFNGTGHKVYNNVIYDVNLISGNFTAIEIRSTATAPEIYFNTISIDNSSSTTGNLFGIKEELSNTNSILRNNIISISQPTTGTKAGLVIGATATVTSAFNSNYNDIWVPSGNVAMKNQLSPIYYPTLADWRTASTQDMNSVSIDPVFVSANTAVPTNLGMNNAGITISWITTDVLGLPRSTPPDVGAYEFPLPVDVEQNLNVLEFSLYPNPVASYSEITVRLSSVVNAGSLIINDIDGKEIMRYHLMSYSTVQAIKLPQLVSGVYVARMEGGEVREMVKFVVK
jgi:hypothetical protein